jgi:hypothetical protein
VYYYATTTEIKKKVSPIPLKDWNLYVVVYNELLYCRWLSGNYQSLSKVG